MSSSTDRGPGRPRKRPADEVYESVLCSARTVFADIGFEAATVDGIAKVAGVTRQAVYEHFSGKEALFDAALRDTIASAAEVREASDRELDPAAPDWVKRRYAALVDFAIEYPEHVRLMQEAGWRRHPAILEAVRAEVASNVAGLRKYSGNQDTALDLGRSPELLAKISAALARAVLEQQWEGETPSAATLTEMVAVYTAGGVAALLEHDSAALRKLS